MSPLMISLVVFIGVQAVLGVLLFLFNDGSAKIADRLEMLTGRKKKEDEATSILKKTAIEHDKKSLLEALTPNIPSLQKLLMQADANIKPSTFMGIGVRAGRAWLHRSSWMMGVKIYLAPIAGHPVLHWCRLPGCCTSAASRLKTFAAQLPEALELVARALRAGHSLAAGMHVVAEEMPLPIADEFNRVYEEQNLGIPIEDALKNMCDRVPNLDLRFFVTACCIQRQTGGDLAEILDKIGYVDPRAFPHPRPGEGADRGRPAVRRHPDRVAVRVVPDDAAHEVRLRREAVDASAGHQDERWRRWSCSCSGRW